MKFSRYGSNLELDNYIDAKKLPKLGCVSTCMCINCKAIYEDSICCCVAYSCGFFCDMCGYDSRSKINQRISTTYVLTSLYANPFHGGHLSLLKAAKQLGDKLIVIVNNDEQVKIKGSQPFLSQDERLEIIRELRCVDACCIAIDKDGTVAETLDRLINYYSNQKLLQTVIFQEQVKFIFAKGGDRKNSSCMPSSELEVCEKYNIDVIYGVGGFDKKNSSSEILKKVNNVQNNSDTNFVS